MMIVAGFCFEEEEKKRVCHVAHPDSPMLYNIKTPNVTQMEPERTWVWFEINVVGHCQKALLGEFLNVLVIERRCSFVIDMNLTVGPKHVTCILEETKHEIHMHPLNSQGNTNPIVLIIKISF